MAREKIVRDESEYIPAVANHDLGLEGQPSFDFSSQLGTGDWLPDNEGASRTDVDDIEASQFFGELLGSERLVSADIDASQKKDQCHEMPPASGAFTNGNG